MKEPTRNGGLSLDDPAEHRRGSLGQRTARGAGGWVAVCMWHPHNTALPRNARLRKGARCWISSVKTGIGASDVYSIH
jgi:hypothetical protein